MSRHRFKNDRVIENELDTYSAYAGTLVREDDEAPHYVDSDIVWNITLSYVEALEEIQRLRTALTFYANPATYTSDDFLGKPIQSIGGKIAREALGDK